MKKILLLGVFLLCVTFIQATEVPFQKAEIKSIMRKVADWQIANPHPAPEHDDLNWPQGALYVGMVDWAELAEKEDNDDTYYKWLTRIGQRNCWQSFLYLRYKSKKDCETAELLAAGQTVLSC